LTKAKDKNLKPENMGALLETLIDHGVEDAETHAKSFLSLPLSSDEDDRARAVVAASVLVTHSKDAGWSVVWPRLLGDPVFAKELVSVVASKQDWGRVSGIWQRVGEDQLADLFIWLTKQYPYAEDPQRGEAGPVTAREDIANWRDAILQNLKKAHRVIEWVKINVFTAPATWK
jgi:hypothetical protein